MGTSSMYSGPNRSPLLPPGFNDGDGNPGSPNPQNKPEQKPEGGKPEGENRPKENNPSETPHENESAPVESSSNIPQYSSWRPAKNSMSKYVSGHGGQNGKRNAVSNYLKSYGGSRNAAKSAKSAIRTTISIGNFFGGVSKKGIAQVLNDYQIPTEGRKPKEILSDIVNILAPTPDLNDDSVARNALVNTMSIIYEIFDEEKKEISLLDSLDPDNTKMIIKK